MITTLRAGILGATGLVGRTGLTLLENHPWFDVSYLAASPNSAGKTYSQAVLGKWQGQLPDHLARKMVYDASDVSSAIDRCDFVISAFEPGKDVKDKNNFVRDLEMNYARAGFPVISCNSAFRSDPLVPMLIPEINLNHLDIIASQKEFYGLEKGFVVTKPNCSIQSFMIPIYSLIARGLDVEEINVVTQQALSGAGDNGPSAYLMGNNRLPYISGEKEKTEKEPLKIFGNVQDDKIVNNDSILICSQNNRDSVLNGHSANVSLRFKRKENFILPTLEEIVSIWDNFKSNNSLPSSPEKPIIYSSENDFPNPSSHVNLGNGMSVSVGQLRKANSNYFDIQFVGLSHNMIRGAVGGAIQTAELLVDQGYIN